MHNMHCLLYLILTLILIDNVKNENGCKPSIACCSLPHNPHRNRKCYYFVHINISCYAKQVEGQKSFAAINDSEFSSFSVSRLIFTLGCKE